MADGAGSGPFGTEEAVGAVAPGASLSSDNKNFSTALRASGAGGFDSTANPSSCRDFCWASFAVSSRPANEAD